MKGGGRIGEAVGVVGSLPGHGAADLAADFADLAVRGEFGKQMSRQREMFGLKGYGFTTSIPWDELVEDHEPNESARYIPSDLAREAHEIVRTRDADAALALLYRALRERLL